jgi:small GTP-binding protein
MILKILLIGDYGVGKSSILRKYIYGNFDNSYCATIGVDFTFREIILNEKKVKIQLWDTAGQERFRSITKSFYKGKTTYILVFDLSDYDSFCNLPYWISDINKYSDNDNNIFFLIGTKNDLDRVVPKNEIEKFLQEYNIKDYFTISSKTDDSIDIVFEKIANNLISLNYYYEYEEVKKPVMNSCCWR